MGTTLNAVDNLGPPFRSIDEQVFVIPRGSSNEIDNTLFKINFMLHGSCLHEIDDEGPVRFETGDIIVIPRVCRQRYWPSGPRDSHRLHAVRLVFDPVCLPPLTAGDVPNIRLADAERDLVSHIRQHLCEVRHLPQGQDAVIRLILAELRQEARQRAPGYRFRATALCTALVVDIARRLNHAGSAQASARASHSHLILHAKEYLYKNLKRSLELDEIAGHLHVSSEHLARVFKEETGQTVFAHLRQLRLEKAKTYLIGTDKTITDIAALTGFTSVALFSRTFRRFLGVNPLQYRQERWRQTLEDH